MVQEPGWIMTQESLRAAFGLLSAIVKNGYIKFPLQGSPSNINLSRCSLKISHTFQSHGSVSDPKKSSLRMLHGMEFGDSYSNLILALLLLRLCPVFRRL